MNGNNKMTPKRIAAWIGIVLLVGMYVVLLIEALVGAPGTGNMFLACLAATVAIPIIIWIFIWIYGMFTGRHTIASLDAMTSDKEHDQDGNVVASGKIKTVVFDIGNVLADFGWEQLIKSYGYDDSMTERIANASVHTPCWKEYDRGVMTNEEILQSFIKNDPEIEADIRKVFTNLDGLMIKRDRSIPWIEALKGAGYRVLVLSNFSSQAYEGNREVLSFLDHVDGGILSYRDKLIKPDPAIYKLLADRYDLIPEETVFIDDTHENITAAKALGWEGIVYKDYQQVKDELNELGVQY